VANLREAQHQLAAALQRMHEPPTTWPERMQHALNGAGIFRHQEFWPIPLLHRVEGLAEMVALTEAVIYRLADSLGPGA